MGFLVKSLFLFAFSRLSNHRFVTKSTLATRSFTLVHDFSKAKMSEHELVIDPFCIRQFNNPNYTGTHVNYDIQEFETKVNEYYKQGYPLFDGYAPFW
jgi:hypothetical protein